MSTVRYTQGLATVGVTFDEERFLRDAMASVSGGVVEAIEAAGEAVASQARRDWYTQVTRRTGRSGDVGTTVTIDTNKEKATVSVGSTDLEKAKYVHRPGRLSTVPVEITEKEYRDARAKGGAVAATVFHARKTQPGKTEAGKWYRSEHSPNANDGKYLIGELIRKPMTQAMKALQPQILEAIDKRLKAGNHG